MPAGDSNKPIREDDPVPPPSDLLNSQAQEKSNENKAEGKKATSHHDLSLARTRSYSRLRMPSFYSPSKPLASVSFAPPTFQRLPPYAFATDNYPIASPPQSIGVSSEKRASLVHPAVTSISFLPSQSAPSASVVSPPQSPRSSLRLAAASVTMPATASSQIVVKVMYNKTVYGSREKRSNLMSVLYEKLANKIREDFVLTASDSHDIIERSSQSTFDDFLGESNGAEIQLKAVPFDYVVRVRVTHETTQWECLALNVTPLSAFRDLVARHYFLNSADFSLTPTPSSISSSVEPMPNRDDLSIGAWAASLLSAAPSSSTATASHILELTLSLDVALRIEQKSDILYLSEKAQSTVEFMYRKVAEWKAKPTTAFYLASAGTLLGRTSQALISTLPIATTSMVHLQVVDADSVVKFFVVHPDHTVTLFGYPPDATVSDVWPDLVNMFPHDVIFPYESGWVNADTREMFVTQWEKAVLASSTFVLEVLLESETMEVDVEIGDITAHLLSRFGTVVGDIFNSFISVDELNGYLFVGHNEEEFISHEGEWVSYKLE